MLKKKIKDTVENLAKLGLEISFLCIKKIDKASKKSMDKFDQIKM